MVTVLKLPGCYGHTETLNSRNEERNLGFQSARVISATRGD